MQLRPYLTHTVKDQLARDLGNPQGNEMTEGSKTKESEEKPVGAKSMSITADRDTAEKAVIILRN